MAFSFGYYKLHLWRTKCLLLFIHCQVSLFKGTLFSFWPLVVMWINVCMTRMHMYRHGFTLFHWSKNWFVLWGRKYIHHICQTSKLFVYKKISHGTFNVANLPELSIIAVETLFPIFWAYFVPQIWPEHKRKINILKLNRFVLGYFSSHKID